MVVILVLIIALGVGLAAASGRFSVSATRHEEQQAYYTAFSSTQTIAHWITSATDTGASAETVAGVNALLATIPSYTNNPNGVDVAQTGLPTAAGTCVVNLRYVDTEDSTLKITSTATVADVSETVSLSITKVLAGNSFGPELKVSDFTTTSYDTSAGQIGALRSGGTIFLYDPNANDNSSANTNDLNILNAAIPANSTKEARWTNVDIYNSTGSFDNRVLGTQRYPLNDQYDSDTDNRRFQAPANGKIMIDPMEDGGAASTATNSLDNTKISSLAISGTAGKTVRFRLVSGEAAKGSVNEVNRSKSYLNSLLLFNFTDNANSTEVLQYEVDGKAQSYTWHPDKWTSLDLYVQANSEVTSNLILGPFGHKHDDFLDYRSWGNFVDNWHGTTYKGYQSLWPYASSASTNGNLFKGLPIFPVDYGKNAHFWILDGRTDRSFQVLQGVNIINGSIYSNRKTIIGGGLLRKDTTGLTLESINQGMLGYSLAASNSQSLYVDATVRYDQLIYNTDIILKAPSGNGTAESVIHRPFTWDDKPVAYHDFDKTFNPRMIIKGGTIYVGARQSLTVQGTETAPLNGPGVPRVPLDNMWISPDKIVVAANGKLTINKSETINVLTDIYVAGGTLVINANAKIKGNIYVYNGGVVEVAGDFLLESPSGENKPEHGGIFIYGEDTVSGSGIGGSGGISGVTAAGTIKTPSLLFRFQNGKGGSLATGKVHLIGGDWAKLVNGPSSLAGLGSDYSKRFLCDDHDASTGRCEHYGSGSANGTLTGWTIGSFGGG